MWRNKWGASGYQSSDVQGVIEISDRKCSYQLHLDLALSSTNSWRLFGVEAAYHLCPRGP